MSLTRRIRSGISRTSSDKNSLLDDDFEGGGAINKSTPESVDKSGVQYISDTNRDRYEGARKHVDSSKFNRWYVQMPAWLMLLQLSQLFINPCFILMHDQVTARECSHAGWTWYGIVIFVILNLPAPLFLIVNYNKWSETIIAILDIEYKNMAEELRIENRFKRSVLGLGITLLINVPISICFRSDLSMSFNTFWILTCFTMFFSMSKMQPAWHRSVDNSINGKWRSRNKSKLQMLNIEKQQRINYEFAEVRQAIKTRRYSNLNNHESDAKLSKGAIYFFILVCSCYGLAWGFPNFFTLLMPDLDNWPMIATIMVLSGFIYYFIQVISRIHYFSINREIIAWSNELEAISTLTNTGRSANAPDRDSNPGLEKQKIMDEDDINEESKQEKARILLNSLIDPSDPDSPLVWFEIRRIFIENSEQITKVEHMLNSLNIIAYPSLILAAYIALRVFFMYRWPFLNMMNCFLIIFVVESIYTVFVNIQQILRAQGISIGHQGGLDGLKDMVSWTMRNEDDESANVSLQELVYDQSVTSQEIREGAKGFLKNLEEVRNKCGGHQFKPFQFLGYDINPSNYGKLKAYIYSIITPIVYRLGQMIVDWLYSFTDLSQMGVDPPKV